MVESVHLLKLGLLNVVNNKFAGWPKK